MDYLSFADLFEAQVQRTGQACALVEGVRHWTYAELNAQANALAHMLQARGVKRADIVAIAMMRGAQNIISELAVTKVGAAFLPLEPNYPLQRIAHMVEDAKPALILTNKAFSADLPHQYEQIVVDHPGTLRGLERHSTENIERQHCKLDDLAYVIYTSGSTGQPKGVMVSHRGLHNLADALVDHFAVTAQSRVAQIASPGFDISVMEMLMAFRAGATLVTLIRSTLVAQVLEQELEQNRISHMVLTPTALASINEQNLSSLQVVGVGAETCMPHLVERWASRVRMINAYGPTEITACASMSSVLDSVPRGARVPIGKALPNTQLMVLDPHLRPAPIGVTGELYIGGIGLARGYLARAGLSAERFVANPYGPPGSRMYRSGDLVRWRRDRQLEFIGRADGQIKLRGHRIELGEIEASLGDHPGIAQNVTVVREDRPGDKRLVAYLVVRDLHRPEPAALRAYLLTRLPEPMVPAHFVFLDRLPMTPNGKLDKEALPMPEAPAEHVAQLPSTATEHKLCELFAKTLGLPEVADVKANFFELGGHSMLAIQLGRNIRDELRPDFPLAGVYTIPVLIDLAAMIDGNVVLDEALDLDRDSGLPIFWSSHDPRRRRALPQRMDQVFLTGATGYVGSHLLASLIRDTQATIVCLVRAHDELAGRARVLQALAQQRLEGVWRSERVKIALGDLAQANLGMDDINIRRVVEEGDTIVHCGALVDFLHPYSSLRAPNVDSVLTLIEWTTQGCPKRLHHVSSLGIADVSAMQGVLTEASPFDAWRGLVGGYNQSKWAADRMARHAQEQGLPVTLYRLGSVVGDHASALCNTSDFLWQLGLLCVALGAVPALDLRLNLTPVDDVARGIVQLARQPSSMGKIFHMLGEQTLSLPDIAPILNDIGQTVDVIGLDDWGKRAQKFLMTQNDSQMLAILAMLSKYTEKHSMGPRIEGPQTIEALREAKASIRPVTAQLMQRYFVNLGVKPNVVAA